MLVEVLSGALVSPPTPASSVVEAVKCSVSVHRLKSEQSLLEYAGAGGAVPFDRSRALRPFSIVSIPCGCGRDRTNAIYLKETPIRLAERQATWQLRFVGSGLIWSVKSSGIPTGLATSRQAPVSDKLRTTQSTVAAAPKIIDAPLSVRTRGLARFSIIHSD